MKVSQLMPGSSSAPALKEIIQCSSIKVYPIQQPVARKTFGWQIAQITFAFFTKML